MIKKSAIIVLIALLLSQLTSEMFNQLSRDMVDHIEAGNFINAETIGMEHVTMLHWFSGDVQVYSENNAELFFVVFNPYGGVTMYKDKKLLLQNESVQYPKYQSGDHMTFHINEEDYDDKRVDLHTEKLPSLISSKRFPGNYFVGTEDKINQLILTKFSMRAITTVLTFLLILATILVYKKLTYSLLLIGMSVLMFIKLEIGLLFFVTLLYFLTDKLLKKRGRTRLLILSILGVVFLTLLNQFKQEPVVIYGHMDLYVSFVLFFLVLSVLNFIKDRNYHSFICMGTNTCLFLMLNLDYEFSLFRIFYEEILMTIVCITFILLIYKNLRIHFSKDEMVKLDLLRGVSHDLRVPISTISLNTGLLEKDDFTTEANKNMILQVIKGATGDLVNMTNSLTAYMSEDGYVNNQYKSSFHHAIAHASRYYLNNEKSIELKTNLCEEDIYLPIDEIWLNRMIFNLVDNAYKYTDAYGEIIITLRKSKNTIIFSVEDNGIGMKKEELEKIIEPFYRVDKSRSISGLGLGLSIVKSIVNKLEGCLLISSKIGVGTIFTIEI